MTTVYRPNVRSNTRPGLFPSLLSTLVLLGAVALPTQAQPIRVEIDPSIKPQNPELLLKPLLDNAEAALKARRFDDAVRYYQSATEYEPDNERHLPRRWALAQSQRGDFRASAEAFRRAIALDSNNADFHAGLGFALGNLEEYDQASQAYRKAIAQDSKKYDAYVGLGSVLQRQKRFDEAATVYTQLKSLQPRDWRPYEALGTILIQKRKYAEALPLLQQAEGFAPSNGRIQLSKAVAFLGLNRPSEGASALEKAAVIERTNAQIFFKLGEVYQIMGQGQKAFEAFRTAVKLQPDFLEAQSAIGKLLMAERDYPRAMIVYRQILEKSPKDADAYFNLAIALRARDRVSEAVEALTSAQRFFKEQGNREKLAETEKLLKELR
ncbi:MAG: tetratricopeptide repeat protein [Synechococcales cyanobacterium RU_4_20]|nr:tetratricopeptide repeat protein [Synechococcales cyanobacterium RU_4_20]